MADQLLRAENMTVGYGGMPLIRDIALSMPAVLGLDGVETHVPISLNEDETTRLIQSAETLKGIAEGLEL